MTNWIEHNGGPQPVADDVWVEVEYPIMDPAADPLSDVPCYAIHMAGEHLWDEASHYRVLNQHLIDAARLEGIRLGLGDAHIIIGGMLKDDTPEDHATLIMRAEAKIIFALENPETIAQEAVLDQLTREAQADNMGYDKETAR